MPSTTLYDQAADQPQPEPRPIEELILEALTENLVATRQLVRNVRQLDEAVTALLLSR